jgi:hypothetical protein
MIGVGVLAAFALTMQASVTSPDVSPKCAELIAAYSRTIDVRFHGHPPGSEGRRIIRAEAHVRRRRVAAGDQIAAICGSNSVSGAEDAANEEAAHIQLWFNGTPTLSYEWSNVCRDQQNLYRLERMLRQ